MTTSRILPALLAGALGLAGGYSAHTDGPTAAIISYLNERLKNSITQSPTKTLEDSLKRLRESTTAVTPTQPTPQLSQRTPHVSPEMIDPPDYIPEKIDRVEFVYTNARTREIFHQGLQIILNQYPDTNSLGERIDRMRQLHVYFFSTGFGITDPVWLGGYTTGTPVMDEERATRIRDHAIRLFGELQPTPQRPGILRRVTPTSRGDQERVYGDWLGRRVTPRQEYSPQPSYRSGGAGSFWSPQPIR